MAAMITTPLAAEAQQAGKMYRIGMLERPTSPSSSPQSWSW
jgi:hypothetical protein